MQWGFVILTILTTLLVVPLTYLAAISIWELCIKLADKTCHKNSDCADWEECTNSTCLLACADKICGMNEHCVGIAHTYTCECLPGFVRNVTSTCILSVIKPYLWAMIDPNHTYAKKSSNKTAINTTRKVAIKKPK